MKKLAITFMIQALILMFNISYGFSDTENHWAKEYINWATEEEIVNGYEDGTFRPNAEIKINEFLKILSEASKCKMVLVGSRWPNWYIETAKAYGWVEENQFSDYDKKITRDEAVAIIAKYIDLSNVKKSNKNLKDLNFKNKSNVLKLITLGVINGYEDNTFKGEKTITRAEAIKLVKNAVDAHQKVINEQKCKLEKSITNIGKEKGESLFRNRYEIRGNEIYFYDDGRYANLDGYKLNSDFVDNAKVIKLIKSIVSTDTYTSVNYVPDDKTVSQLIIAHADRESYLYNGTERFSITFYPDGLYNLKQVTLEDSFSDKCFMKIKVAKLWFWRYELNDGTYLNENKLKRLENAITAVLGEDFTKEFMPYLREKIAEGQLRAYNEKIIDTIEIGKYRIDIYAFEGARVEFYISEN